MGRNRAVRSGLLVVVAVAGMLFACAAGPAVLKLLFSLRDYVLLAELKSRQPANLSFIYRRCPEAGPDRGDHLVAAEWLEDDLLRCTVVATVNCADEHALGGYRIEDGDRLILLYSTVSFWGEAACLCPMEMVYEIRGFEKRDYSISIRRGPSGRP